MMKDRSSVIFGNHMSAKTIKKANKSKKKYIKKFKDDSDVDYSIVLEENQQIGDLLNVVNIKLGNEGKGIFDEKSIIVGNIRMGFGHYRISMAMASCAKALGYTPYWMDLNSFSETTCTKVISSQNDLYSLGSRWSSKSKLFNKFVWEPMNYEGFRKISYNASDQKNAELMAPVFRNVPKDIPVVTTHVWPSQAALHGGMKYVVNAIPDNWPMALHLSEGSLHTVQTYSSYIGYRTLHGMDKNHVLKGMGKDDIVYTGHYIDHELVANIEEDCAKRIERLQHNKALRVLLTVGGAGAQVEMFTGIIQHLLPLVKENKVVLYMNVGDYFNVYEILCSKIPGLKEVTTLHHNDFKETESFALKAYQEDIQGIHVFYHENIFEAVYSTNLLMRSSDILMTKPSELAFYPVPKLFIKRVGGHEKWGAIHSAEIGDGTIECETLPYIYQVLDLMLEDHSILEDMNNNIIRNKSDGIYDGGYNVIKEAIRLKEGQ